MVSHVDVVGFSSQVHLHGSYAIDTLLFRAGVLRVFLAP